MEALISKGVPHVSEYCAVGVNNIKGIPVLNIQTFTLRLGLCSNVKIAHYSFTILFNLSTIWSLILSYIV